MGEKLKCAFIGGLAVGVVVGLVYMVLSLAGAVPILNILAGFASCGMCIIFPLFGLIAGALGVHLARKEVLSLVDAGFVGLVAGVTEGLCGWILGMIGAVIALAITTVLGIAESATVGLIAAVMGFIFKILLGGLFNLLLSFVFGVVMGVLGGVLYAIIVLKVE